MVRPLLESPGGGLASSPVSVPPPHNFKPVVGEPRRISIRSAPYVRKNGDTASKEAGLLYEHKVQKVLSEKFGSRYMGEPWIHFFDDSGARTIRPDGILLASGIKVIEIKSQHMPEAWWQLEKLYKPVLEAYYGMHSVSCVEIVRSYDPAMPFPGEFDIIRWHDTLATYDGKFGVLPWRM